MNKSVISQIKKGRDSDIITSLGTKLKFSVKNLKVSSKFVVQMPKWPSLWTMAGPRHNLNQIAMEVKNAQ